MIVQHRRGLALCTTVALGSLAFASGASAAPIGWSLQYGSPNGDLVEDMATNSRGEVFVVGDTQGSLAPGDNAGGWDGFVVKFDKDGNQKWAARLGTAGGDFAVGVGALSNGDVVVAGNTTDTLGTSSFGDYDVFVARYDKNGNRKWLTQFGTSAGEDVTDVAVTSSGIVYVVGGTQGTFDGNATNTAGEDALLARLDAQGNVSWVRQLNGSGDDLAQAVAIGANETVRVGGLAASATLLGHTNLGGNDAFLTTFDKKGVQGATAWWATSGDDSVEDVAITSTGEVRVAGLTGGVLGDANAGNNDIFVARLTKTLQQTWIEQFGTTAYESVSHIVVAKNGTTYVAGSTSASWYGVPALGGYDALLFAVDKNGVLGQSRLLGTSANDNGLGIALRSSNANGGALVVAGQTQGSLFGFTGTSTDGFLVTLPI